MIVYLPMNTFLGLRVWFGVGGQREVQSRMMRRCTTSIWQLIWRTRRIILPMAYSSYKNFTAKMRDVAWYMVASSVV